ncbi:MAG TPA: hypothetical protein DDY37_05965 [Legionella sp.]|nr:hypothetical protein [Legionella sp.]
MSRIVKALLTQREWQKCELTQQLFICEQQRLDLELTIQENQQNITNSCTMPALIRPELEMARMHYWISQEQTRAALVADKEDLDVRQAALKTRKIELNTALKMLAKHQGRQLEKKRIAMMLTQQNNSDEWIAQRREFE